MATIGAHCVPENRRLQPSEVEDCRYGKRHCAKGTPCQNMRLFQVVNGKNWRSDDRRNGTGDKRRPRSRELLAMEG